MFLRIGSQYINLDNVTEIHTDYQARAAGVMAPTSLVRVDFVASEPTYFKNEGAQAIRDWLLETEMDPEGYGPLISDAMDFDPDIANPRDMTMTIIDVREKLYRLSRTVCKLATDRPDLTTSLHRIYEAQACLHDALGPLREFTPKPEGTTREGS